MFFYDVFTSDSSISGSLCSFTLMEYVLVLVYTFIIPFLTDNNRQTVAEWIVFSWRGLLLTAGEQSPVTLLFV